jgi:hypothetical protein
MGKKKEHQWGYMGVTKGGEEIAQCQVPTCRKWRIGVNSKQLKTMSDTRYQQMVKERLIVV